MNQRTLAGRLWSPAGFGLVFIFFLLPLLTVSCGNGDAQIDSTFNGVDVVVGGAPSVAGPDVTPDSAPQLIAVFADSLVWQPLAGLAVLAVLAGIGVGFIRRPRVQHAASLVLAGLACALLVAEVRLVPGQVTAALARVSDDGTKLSAPVGWGVHLRYGFWLITAGLILLAAAHASGLMRASSRPRAPTPSTGADRGS